MKFLTALINDIHYQAKYGFYLMYLIFSILYTAALFLCPQEYRKTAASLIVLTDPAMLGSFFIGGIWLLEKGEGLHKYISILPLSGTAYIFSKAVSLAIISTLSADLIVLIGLRIPINFFVLSTGIFTGSMIFTTTGLMIASCSRSVNHYMLLVSPLEVFVTLPPVLAVFGITHPVLNLTPGMALWHLICNSVGMSGTSIIGLYPILALWLGLLIFLACRRIPKAMQTEGIEL